MKERPPQDIEKSIKERNLEHLRAAGRKGAKVTNLKKDIVRTLTEIEVERRSFEDELQRRAANGHIISPDGEDMDFNPHIDDFEKN